MIRAKHARLIRIGIMAKCLPYKANIEPDPVFGGYYEILDLTKLDKFHRDFVMNNNIPLVQKAYERTEKWTRTWLV